MRITFADGSVVNAEEIEPHTSYGEDMCRIWLTKECADKLNVIGFIYAKYAEITHISCK